jgi:hypothetical protein
MSRAEDVLNLNGSQIFIRVSQRIPLENTLLGIEAAGLSRKGEFNIDVGYSLFRKIS